MTSEQIHDLAVKIQDGNFVDDNGKEITVLGPTVWGGTGTVTLYNDLVWTGVTGEKFMTDESGKISHESQTDYGVKRVENVLQLMDEGLMTPEYYTMEESRAKEGVVGWIIFYGYKHHNYIVENNDLTYVPPGAVERVHTNYGHFV